ncbi:MAG: hypothetical protein QOK42_182 [Frankiaceae bacterium]|nr:hypothetical protein [Frankiaceae bacterium]
MRRARRVIVVVSAAGLALVGTAWAGKTPTAPAGLAFRPGVLLTTSGLPYGITQGEPSIKVDSAGRIYVSAPAANGIGCELWRLNSTLTQQTFIRPPDNGVGGGDCDIAVSRTTPVGQSFPTLSYSSLYLANFVVARSLDGGTTWSTSPVGSDWVGDDRQWNAAAEGSSVYMSYHIVTTNNIQIEKSTDGGLTYHVTTFPVPTTPGNGQAIDAAHLPQANMNNELGPIVVDFSSTAAVKPVYTIFTAPDSLSENTGSGDGSTHTFNHDLFLAASTDGGVTWRDTLIFKGPVDRTYDHIFPSLAIDSGGGFWATWVSDEEHVYVVHGTRASNGTVTWTAPKRIDTAATLANVYPWVVGGAAGRADVVWYSGTSTDPTLTNNDTTNDWSVRLAQLTWASKSGVTVAAQTVASDHVIRHGDICSKGVLCDPTATGRNLLDFFQVALMPDGRAAIAWADDHATPGAQIYVTVQCSGISATTGKALTSTC